MKPGKGTVQYPFWAEPPNTGHDREAPSEQWKIEQAFLTLTSTGGYEKTMRA